jgi:hypothetical protein
LFGSATINALNEKVQSYVLQTCADSEAFEFAAGATAETPMATDTDTTKEPDMKG